MITTKLNESFYKIEGTQEQLQPIIRRLQVPIEGARFDPMVKRGLKPSYQSFYNIVEGTVIVPSGIIQFLTQFGVVPEPRVQEFTREDIDVYIDTLDLPFTPYDYQLEAVYDSILNQQQLALSATGSGKSVILAIICGFFMSKNLKGLILVPSISLTTQLHQDILDYNLQEVYDNTHLIGGENNDKNLSSKLHISTWQSAMKIKDQMDTLDYIIIDECHGLKNDTQSTDIVYKSINAKYRIGLTGTLPEDPVAIMSILTCVGAPKVYIKTQGLIERGLATPVNINVIKLQYGPDDKAIFKHVGNFAKQLSFIKEHENRNKFISKLAIGTSIQGNSVVMCSHVQHMKDIFLELMSSKYPEVQVENKDIVGTKAFDFQNKYGIYYIAGATKVKDRIKIIDLLKEHQPSNVILRFEEIVIKVNENDMVPLNDGLFKKANDVTIEDDVCDNWIEINK